MTMLTPPSEFLNACPKFRLLVLGNPESTKRELFTKIFGVDLEKVSATPESRPLFETGSHTSYALDSSH